MAIMAMGSDTVQMLPTPPHTRQLLLFISNLTVDTIAAIRDHTDTLRAHTPSLTTLIIILLLILIPILILMDIMVITTGEGHHRSETASASSLEWSLHRTHTTTEIKGAVATTLFPERIIALARAP